MPIIKVLIFLLFAAVFTLVILLIEPPQTWQQASIFQILAFFIPLIVTTTLLLDFFIRYMPHSFIIALGFIMALAFYAVRELNFLTGTLVILITVFGWRVFPKMKLPRFRLTGSSKIPKLHMRKQEQPKLRGLRRLKLRS